MRQIRLNVDCATQMLHGDTGPIQAEKREPQVEMNQRVVGRGSQGLAKGGLRSDEITALKRPCRPGCRRHAGPLERFQHGLAAFRVGLHSQELFQRSDGGSPLAELALGLGEFGQRGRGWRIPFESSPERHLRFGRLPGFEKNGSQH